MTLTEYRFSCECGTRERVTATFTIAQRLCPCCGKVMDKVEETLKPSEMLIGLVADPLPEPKS